MPLSDYLSIHHADVRDLLPTIAAGSVDLVLTDPPFGIGQTDRTPGEPKFDHDSLAFSSAFWAGVRRTLGPGALVLSFTATRTGHRVATALEDAGFTILDQIVTLRGHGFPAGDVQVDGRHTRLRPAVEPIVVAANLAPGQTFGGSLRAGEAHAFDVDAVRIPTNEDRSRMPGKVRAEHAVRVQRRGHGRVDAHAAGRWPSNVVLEHEPRCTDSECAETCPATVVDEGGRQKYRAGRERASRLFSQVRYAPRATPGGHPTAKAESLATWLAELTVAPHMTILEPFAGGGSLALAAARRLAELGGGGRVIAVEKEVKYVDLMRSAISKV
ncbi:DNA methyltransferase [Leifsonia sp. Leaf264]|uniref:DNA methyltransferase n=1 Tax=Leifsonia sp. Leaf264 TaxID=1736314 RepID=UPI000A8EA3A5|nr:DNA methyltransferase [Leifsonia sp. Leaf264]